VTVIMCTRTSRSGHTSSKQARLLPWEQRRKRPMSSYSQVTAAWMLPILLGQTDYNNTLTTIADMTLLEKTAAEVHAEFIDGNIVVKRTKRRLNKVSADQATGWIIKTCKMHNGTIGIKRNDQARDKFYVTWWEWSCIYKKPGHFLI